MDSEKSDLDQARKEAIGYVRDRRSKDEHHRHRKSKADRHSRSTSRSHMDPVSPRHRASSVGSPSGRHRKSSTRHRDEEDREAKRRSRRSKSPAVLPGAVRSTGHHKSRTKSSSSHRDSIKSDEKVRRSSRSHSSRPGAVSESTKHDPRRSKRDPSSSKSHGDSKSDCRDSKAVPASTNNRKSDPFATMDGGEHFAVAASIVVDDEEERIRKRMEEREAEIRLEIEMQQHVEANAATVQDQDQKTKPRQRQGNRGKVCCAIVCLVLIAGSIVGALFGTGAIRSSLEPTVSSDLDNEKNVQDTPDGNDDTPGNRTSAPSVGGMDPSSVPTSAPTFLAYDPPDTEQCESIRQGQEVQGQEEMIENNFALVINGTLSQDADIESVKAALTNSIQKIIMPKLSGCDESDLQRRRLRRGVMKRRRLQDPYAYIVGNVVVVDITSLGECVENQTCESFQVDIVLYSQGDEVNTIGLIGRISDAFNNGESLVVQLEIDQFFDHVDLVGVLALDPTPEPSDAPSSEPSSVPTGAPTTTASLSPTFAPVSFPTTKSPTGKPSPGPTTGTPSKVPSSAPTNVPSSSPSSRPSIQPAPGATPMPTSEPSTSPTNAPTSVPTSGPTNAPTSGPTSSPTDAPSSEPSLHPTSAPTSQPTSGPTSGPTSRPTNAPSSSPTVKTRLQIITDALVSTAGIDENDLHDDIVSWMDTVDSWEPASDDPSYWAERYAMAVYFKETQGSNWSLMDTGVSDRSGVSVCSWNGVSCNSNNVVTSFVTNDAWAYSSAATIPTEMGLLSNVKYFQSQSGNVAESGRIPQGILSMTALTQLRLDDSIFTSIGDLSVLSNLKYLDMRSNTVSGSAIPDSLCELTQLTKLILYENNHSNASPNTIPTCVGQLSANMKHFTLGDVNLKGTIPSEIAQLTKLTLLNLRQNDFLPGLYPEFVNALTTLKSLLLDSDQLIGTLPSSISSLTALTLLDLQWNDLIGSIPVLPNNGSIRDCRLRGNTFSNTNNAGSCTV